MALTSSIGTEHKETVDASIALGSTTEVLSDALEIGANEGAIEVIVRSIAATYTTTGTIILQLTSCATESGSYTDCGGAVTVAGSSELTKNEELARLPIPKGALHWIKLSATTSDANENTKTIDMKIAYSPR